MWQYVLHFLVVLHKHVVFVGEKTVFSMGPIETLPLQVSAVVAKQYLSVICFKCNVTCTI